MRKLCDVLSVILGTLIFLPSIFVLNLAYMMGAEEGNRVAQLIATILALLNSATLWWMIYELCVK